MPDLFLKSISIGNGRNTRQYCYFLDDSPGFLLVGGLAGASMINTVIVIIVCVVSIFVFTVNDVRIHGIVCIIDTDIPGTHTMLGLLVEVDAKVQTMAGWQAIIVAPGDVAGFLNRAIGPDDNCRLLGYSDTSPGIEYPGSSYINAVTELMAEIEAEAVAAVIFVRKPSALVDGTVLKAVVGLGQGVCQPAGGLAQCFLRHQF